MTGCCNTFHPPECEGRHVHECSAEPDREKVEAALEELDDLRRVAQAVMKLRTSLREGGSGILDRDALFKKLDWAVERAEARNRPGARP